MESFEKNYNRALRFLSFRLRSEKEIRNYFQKHKVELPIVEKIIEKLKKYNFLNDEEFARLWIEQRIKIKPRAWKTIQFELKQKGISEEIFNLQSASWRTILNSSSGGQFSNEEMAKKLIEKRIQRYKDLSKQELYQKLGRYLAGKGFNWDTIKKSIDESLEKKV